MKHGIRDRGRHADDRQLSDPLSPPLIDSPRASGVSPGGALAAACACSGVSAITIATC
jgi:hypothetical protein